MASVPPGKSSELFVAAARHVPRELPRLTGPDGSEARVAAEYLRMRDRLLPAGLTLASVELDSRGAWRIELGSGLEVRLGRQQVEQRFRRFVDVVIPLLAAADQGAGYVDMRYSRGFAIAWSPAGEPANNQTTGMNQDV